MPQPNNLHLRIFLRSPITLLILLALVAAWSLYSMRYQHSLAQLAADDLSQCQKITDEINSLRQKPALASFQPIETRELAKRIETAAENLVIPPSSIGDIIPQPAQRLGDLPYLQKPTTLTLRDITLPQLGPFLHQIASDTGLTIRDLRLYAFKHDETGSAWNADVVLAGLIFSPVKSDAKSQGTP